MEKQYPTVIITLSNMRVNFKKIRQTQNEQKQFCTFQVSQKVFNKDKQAPARYDNFECVAFDNIDFSKIEDGAIVNISGKFSTEEYNGKQKLKVVVSDVQILETPANTTIQPNDLPF